MTRVNGIQNEGELMMSTQPCQPASRTTATRLAKHVLVIAILCLILYFSLLVIVTPAVE
jgi:hypothetical protein